MKYKLSRAFLDKLAVGKALRSDVRLQRLCRHEGRELRGIASMPEATLSVAALLPTNECIMRGRDFETRNQKFKLYDTRENFFSRH